MTVGIIFSCQIKGLSKVKADKTHSNEKKPRSWLRACAENAPNTTEARSQPHAIPDFFFLSN